MASSSTPSQSHSSSKQKKFLIFVLLVSIPLLFFVLSVKPKRAPLITLELEREKTKPPWFEVIAKGIDSEKIKVGLVNIDARVNGDLQEQLHSLHPQVETVSVDFDHVNESLKWKDFYPEWIDEDEKLGQPKCKDMPMPTSEDYEDVDVVVARVPCGNGGIGSTGTEGIRDVFRLQVNLVVANLAVESGWEKKTDAPFREVYVVFIGSCGPMVELFRCDDLVLRQGEYWVYKPDLRSLKQKTLMPVGSCQIAPGYAEPGKELWKAFVAYEPILNYSSDTKPFVKRLAYVTVLQSSEAYVCGAIALAQSILQHCYQNLSDLILLADESIGSKSIKGLEAAGWKIWRIQRIRNPFAQKGSYNEWNYSKLRIWQLTRYDKIIFIDPDLLLLKSIDDFFYYPQLSAAPNDKTLFNSGLMVIKPSQCMFEDMMLKTSKLQPYNGGDQGFLNEIFTWWQRLPSKANKLKIFQPRHLGKNGNNNNNNNNNKHVLPEDVYAIHYLGLKPWMCYRDYDCNWDMQDHHIYASDSAHQRWWQVYDSMPKELQSYCGLTKKMHERIRERRMEARNASLPDGHWKIEVKDPRRKRYVDYNI